MSECAAPAIHQYVAKLERRARLPGEAREALLAVDVLSRCYQPCQDIITEGDRPNRSCIVQSGMVSRHKTLRSGAVLEVEDAPGLLGQIGQ